MIKSSNYQPHERKLIDRLSELAGTTVSPADASMIIGINRRKSGNRAFTVLPEVQISRNGPHPIYVQDGRYHASFEGIDKSRIFWTIAYIGENYIGALNYAISNRIA